MILDENIIIIEIAFPKLRIAMRLEGASQNLGKTQKKIIEKFNLWEKKVKSRLKKKNFFCSVIFCSLNIFKQNQEVRIETTAKTATFT